MSTSRVPGPMGMDNTEPRKPESGLLGSGGLPGPVGNRRKCPSLSVCWTSGRRSKARN